MMRHASVATTMNHYRTALKADIRVAHEAVAAPSGFNSFQGHLSA